MNLENRSRISQRRQLVGSIRLVVLLVIAMIAALIASFVFLRGPIIQAMRNSGFDRNAQSPRRTISDEIAGNLSSVVHQICDGHEDVISEIRSNQDDVRQAMERFQGDNQPLFRKAEAALVFSLLGDREPFDELVELLTQQEFPSKDPLVNRAIDLTAHFPVNWVKEKPQLIAIQRIRVKELLVHRLMDGKCELIERIFDGVLGSSEIDNSEGSDSLNAFDAHFEKLEDAEVDQLFQQFSKVEREIESDVRENAPFGLEDKKEFEVRILDLIDQFRDGVLVSNRLSEDYLDRIKAAAERQEWFRHGRMVRAFADEARDVAATEWLAKLGDQLIELLESDAQFDRTRLEYLLFDVQHGTRLGAFCQKAVLDSAEDFDTKIRAWLMLLRIEKFEKAESTANQIADTEFKIPRRFQELIDQFPGDRSSWAQSIQRLRYESIIEAGEIYELVGPSESRKLLVRVACKAKTDDLALGLAQAELAQGDQRLVVNSLMSRFEAAKDSRDAVKVGLALEKLGADMSKKWMSMPPLPEDCDAADRFARQWLIGGKSKQDLVDFLNSTDLGDGSLTVQGVESLRPGNNFWSLHDFACAAVGAGNGVAFEGVTYKEMLLTFHAASEGKAKIENVDLDPTNSVIRWTSFGKAQEIYFSNRRLTITDLRDRLNELSEEHNRSQRFACFSSANQSIQIVYCYPETIKMLEEQGIRQLESPK